MQPTPPPQGYAPQPSTPNPAQTAGILMLVCGGLILISLFTKAWGTASEGRESIGFGLTGVSGGGQTIDWDKAKEALEIPGDVATFATLALISGLGAVAGCGIAGGMALSRKTATIPILPVRIAFGVASFCMTYFAFRLSQADHDVQIGPGYSAFLGIGGVIGAGAIMQLMLKKLVDQAKAGMPMGQPMVMAQPMMMAPPPMVACPRCQGGAAFVPQYNRHFCNACQQYV